MPLSTNPTDLRVEAQSEIGSTWKNMFRSSNGRTFRFELVWHDKEINTRRCVVGIERGHPLRDAGYFTDRLLTLSAFVNTYFADIPPMIKRRPEPNRMVGSSIGPRPHRQRDSYVQGQSGH